MNDSMDKIFHPRSIAIVGASEVSGKAGERRTRSLIESGYKGQIYPINPKRDKIFSLKAYPSVKDIEADEIDLAVIIIPPKFIPQAVAESCEKGAKGIIIITAGLGETGEEGKKIEREILEIASKTGTQIIGPNCSGMFSASANVNLLGIPNLKKGPYSVIAQSGNVIDSLSHYARLRNKGFSRIISAGNAIGVKFHEYLYFLKDDPDTKVIMLYLEGIKEGDKLIKAAIETVPQKPVIALKVGRYGAGKRAAASHTGSLAGDDTIVDAAFRQAGILRVSNVDELFDMADVLAHSPLPKGRRIAILSEGGGDNAIAADNAEKYGLEVPVLSEETQEKIRPFLLKGMPASNPIDYGGTAEENPHMITECCNVCMGSDEIDGIYLTGFFGGFREIIAEHVAKLEEETARELLSLVEKYQKPLLLHTSFALEDFESLRILKDGGIPIFESSERVAMGLSYLSRYVEESTRLKNKKPLLPVGDASDSVSNLINAVKQEGRHNLLEIESQKVLREYGLGKLMPETIFAKAKEEAIEAANRIGFPVAMKIVSPDIIHKSDAGGIRLNLKSDEAVESAFEEIIKNGMEVTDREKILGVLISPMVKPGQECIVGMIRDSQFGPVIMFGLGGIFVEVLKDVTFRVLPLYEGDVETMIEEIKGIKLLKGIRGEPAKDINALKNILINISHLALNHPEIKEIDLNPIIVHEKGASIVDSRIIIG